MAADAWYDKRPTVRASRRREVEEEKARLDRYRAENQPKFDETHQQFLRDNERIEESDTILLPLEALLVPDSALRQGRYVGDVLDRPPLSVPQHRRDPLAAVTCSNCAAVGRWFTTLWDGMPCQQCGQEALLEQLSPPIQASFDIVVQRLPHEPYTVVRVLNP